MEQPCSQFPKLISSREKTINKNKYFVIGNYELKYSALFDRVNHCIGLFHQIGLQVGGRVIISSKDEIEVAIMYIAALRSGATLAVLNPFASPAETLLLTEATEPSAIFIDEILANEVLKISAESNIPLFKISKPTNNKSAFRLLRRTKNESSNDNFYPAITKNIEPSSDQLGKIPEDSTALILFTSGTTSRPKGVEITHKNLYAQFETFANHYGFNEKSLIVNHLPLHHTDGLNQAVAITLFVAGTWIRPKDFSLQTLPDMMHSIVKYNATHLITVPTVIALILRLPEEFDDTFSRPDFKFVSSTAGFLDEKPWREFEARFKTTLVNSYGLTETVSEAIYCGPTQETRRVGTIGKPIDCEARIINESGNILNSGSMGELILRGSNVTKGYFNNPEATLEALRDSWLHTGDLAIVDEDGFFTIVGRKKNVIIRGGINIYPEDVSNSIIEASGVLDAVTVGVEDEIMGESAITCVELDGTATLSEQDLIDYCRKNLSPELIPNNIFIIDTLPRGPAGKIELPKVNALIQSKLNTGTSVEHTDDIEEQVFNLAAKAFKISSDKLSNNSHSQNTDGWDSLSILNLIMSIEQHFQIKFSPRSIMKINNLGDVVQIVSLEN